MKQIALIAAVSVLFSALPSYAGNACEVKSGAATAALVELYSSEGCSSCPPADRQLSQLHQTLDAQASVVPLALHVSYWDQIGWKDVFAQKIFDARQSNLLVGRKNHVVYTPQFFVNGTELRSWRDGLPDAIRTINAKPATVAITLKTNATANNTVVVDADVNARDSKTSGVLYLAISESALVSHVLRGENGGATLKHDDVVRVWLGPTALVQGKLHLRQEVNIPTTWNRQNLQAVAFVQDQGNGNVLQAVSTAQCDGTRGL